MFLLWFCYYYLNISCKNITSFTDTHCSGALETITIDEDIDNDDASAEKEYELLTSGDMSLTLVNGELEWCLIDTCIQ